MPRDNTDPVTLPAAASQAAHDFGEQFVFSTTNAHVPPQQVEPLEHVSEQGAAHVPEEIPPEGLPTEASNMDGAAMTQLADHVDWLLS
jgi:hypothetical protein